MRYLQGCLWIFHLQLQKLKYLSQIAHAIPLPSPLLSSTPLLVTISWEASFPKKLHPLGTIRAWHQRNNILFCPLSSCGTESKWSEMKMLAVFVFPPWCTTTAPQGCDPAWFKSIGAEGPRLLMKDYQYLQVIPAFEIINYTAGQTKATTTTSIRNKVWASSHWQEAWDTFSSFAISERTKWSRYLLCFCFDKNKILDHAQELQALKIAVRDVGLRIL